MLKNEDKTLQDIPLQMLLGYDLSLFWWLYSHLESQNILKVYFEINPV